MDRKTILIWGEAGVGKTTFCTKFCQDWALVVTEKEDKGQELTEEQKSELEKLTEEQRNKLNNIGLLIYIVLRNVSQGENSVRDIIISQLGFHKEGGIMSQPHLKKQLLSILENVNIHRKLVLLMDGFDEISDRNEKIEDVISGHSYQSIHSITTCRPHATHGILLKVHVEIRLKGFSELQVQEYVEMYGKNRYSDKREIDVFISHTVGQIESSAELLEMSTNPSMLQLLCLLSWKSSKIGKNRTSVFKDYTCYLLMQYHIKHKEKNVKSFSADLYKQNLLDAGKVALKGLRQNQLQLVFSKSEAHQIGGDAIFNIGFLTELPSTDTESVMVQFTHKTLQEYLAAFYVVNSPGDEGLQLLMEFCSTSQRLMGSQIILEFVSNMSTKMGREIQKKIKDYVSTWDSDDKVDPNSRTSFLISMLKGNKKLTFPLPAVVDIDLHEYDIVPGFFSWLLNIFVRSKSTLERFFDMDAAGVKKIGLVLGEYNRINVLPNTTTDSVNELSINYCNTWSKKDSKELCEVMKKMKPGLLCIIECQRKLMDEATIDVISQHVHTLILEKCDLDNGHLLKILKTRHHFKVLKVNECDVKMDGKVIEAVSKLTSDIKIDISGKEITFIHKSDGMKSLSVANCGIQIDREIAEAVSRLPDHTQLDLSGNKVTDKSACITLMHKAPTMNSLKIRNCGTQIDTEIAEAVSMLPDHTQLDLSGNYITKMKPYLLSRILPYMTKQEKIDINGWGITVDEDIVRALSKLSKLQKLIIYHYYGYDATTSIYPHYSNKLTPEVSSELPHTVRSLPDLQVLYLDYCNISNDVIVALTKSLYKHCPLLEALSLSDNHLSSGVWEVLKHIQQMNNLRRVWLYWNPCVKDDKQRDKIKTTLHRSNPGLNVWLS